MSLFQCDECGCRENTALCNYWMRYESVGGDGVKRCSACDPAIGRWHGKFHRMYLPKGMFVTNPVGNLAHKETGDEDCAKYEIKEQQP